MPSIFSSWRRRKSSGETDRARRLEYKALYAIPEIVLDTQNLCSSREMDLESWFNDERIQKDWEDVYQKIDPYQIPDGTGGVNPGDRRAIFYLIYSLDPKTVLEIGTHIGASTTMAAAALWNRSGGRAESVNLTSIDRLNVNDPISCPWLRYGVEVSPAEMIRDLGFSHFVKFVVDSSIHFISDCQETYDFIFLDGDHSAATVYQEVPLALKRLNPGGCILLHDYFPDAKPLWSNGAVLPGPYLAMDRFINAGANVEVKPLGNLPWPTKLNSNTTSLALLLHV